MTPVFLSPHFSLDELTASQSAARGGIDNTPPEDVIANLARLAAVLEQVRGLLGVPVLVSSGYRCPALNALIGGSTTSAHLSGLACDFTAPKFGTPFEVAAKIADSNLPFDQVIHEYGRWVHLGLSAGVTPRRQCLSIFSGTGYLSGLRSSSAGETRS